MDGWMEELMDGWMDEGMDSWMECRWYHQRMTKEELIMQAASSMLHACKGRQALAME